MSGTVAKLGGVYAQQEVGFLSMEGVNGRHKEAEGKGEKAREKNSQAHDEEKEVVG
jgi:hypothetical protein